MINMNTNIVIDLVKGHSVLSFEQILVRLENAGHEIRPAELFNKLSLCCKKGSIIHEETPNHEHIFYAPSPSKTESKSETITPAPVFRKTTPSYRQPEPVADENKKTYQQILEEIQKIQNSSAIGGAVVHKFPEDAIKDLQLKGLVYVAKGIVRTTY